MSCNNTAFIAKPFHHSVNAFRCFFCQSQSKSASLIYSLSYHWIISSSAGRLSLNGSIFSVSILVLSNHIYCFGCSLDGVPFLMRDRTLRRTTNVRRVFPDRQYDDASFFNWTDLTSLNAGQWFLKVWVILALNYVNSTAEIVCSSVSNIDLFMVRLKSVFRFIVYVYKSSMNFPNCK